MIEFFAYNASHLLEPKYCFPEFSERHVWNSQSKTWTKRKRNKIIGMLIFVAPSEGEQYYLRLLLAHLVGPCSFNALLTVDNHLCSTFHEAALKRSLVGPDDSVTKCLDETAEVQMPHALRKLFATVLIFLEPSDMMQLWNRYFNHLSKDVAQRHLNEPQKILGLTSQYVEMFIENKGRYLTDYGLQHLHTHPDVSICRTRDVRDALDASIPASCMAARKMLTAEQKVAYKRIISHVKPKKKLGFFH